MIGVLFIGRQFFPIVNRVLIIGCGAEILVSPKLLLARHFRSHGFCSPIWYEVSSNNNIPTVTYLGRDLSHQYSVVRTRYNVTCQQCGR